VTPAEVWNAAEIRGWLLSYLAALLQMPPDEISAGDPLAEYGLDSSAAVGLSGDLGLWLGLKLEPDLLYRYPTVDALTAFLTSEDRPR
jgi:acyl carrier protein